MHSQNSQNKPYSAEKSYRKYKKISFQQRKELIRLVCEEHITCAMASRKLKISPSTAKMIVKKFEEQGKIFEKKEDQNKRLIIENFKKSNESGKRGETEVVPAYWYYPAQYDQFLIQWHLFPPSC